MQRMDYSASIKRLKNLDISHQICDYRDYDKVEELHDKVQDFKSRFLNIKQELRKAQLFKEDVKESFPEVLKLSILNFMSSSSIQYRYRVYNYKR